MRVIAPGVIEYGTESTPVPIVTFSITQRAFWRRFTPAEREALQGILYNGTQTQKNKLNAFRDYVIQGGSVELNDDYIRTSVALMETAGILSAGRATQIVDGAISESERPR